MMRAGQPMSRSKDVLAIVSEGVAGFSGSPPGGMWRRIFDPDGGLAGGCPGDVGPVVPPDGIRDPFSRRIIISAAYAAPMSDHSSSNGARTTWQSAILEGGSQIGPVSVKTFGGE